MKGRVADEAATRIRSGGTGWNTTSGYLDELGRWGVRVNLGESVRGRTGIRPRDRAPLYLAIATVSAETTSIVLTPFRTWVGPVILTCLPAKSLALL